MNNALKVLPVSGRVLLAAIFLLSGIGKLSAAAATQAYIGSLGLPAPVLGYYLALLVEIGGGALLLAGYQTRIVALALAGFSVVTAVLFHSNFADQNQMIHFLKNLAIAGGLLQVVAFGAGAFSVDSLFSRRAPVVLRATA